MTIILKCETKVTTCVRDAQCNTGFVCDTGRNLCVPKATPGKCYRVADCKTPKPICELNSNTCVECILDSDCSSGKKCNLNTLTCGSTVSKCKADSDCPKTKPVCRCKSRKGIFVPKY